jgi:hypothetical protein
MAMSTRTSVNCTVYDARTYTNLLGCKHQAHRYLEQEAREEGGWLWYEDFDKKYGPWVEMIYHEEDSSRPHKYPPKHKKTFSKEEWARRYKLAWEDSPDEAMLTQVVTHLKTEHGYKPL